MAYLTE